MCCEPGTALLSRARAALLQCDMWVLYLALFRNKPLLIRLILQYILVQNTLLLPHYKQMWITYSHLINSLLTSFSPVKYKIIGWVNVNHQSCCYPAVNVWLFTVPGGISAMLRLRFWRIICGRACGCYGLARTL